MTSTTGESPIDTLVQAVAQAVIDAIKSSPALAIQLHDAASSPGTPTPPASGEYVGSIKDLVEAIDSNDEVRKSLFEFCEEKAYMRSDEVDDRISNYMSDSSYVDRDDVRSIIDDQGYCDADRVVDIVNDRLKSKEGKKFLTDLVESLDFITEDRACEIANNAIDNATVSAEFSITS